MFLPIQFKPDTSNTDLKKFVFIVENYVSSSICLEIKDYLNKNPATHRRGSKNPETCHAAFSTCLIPEPNKEIYKILEPLLIDYNSRHNFNLIYMEHFELKRYDEGDEFSLHNDNYIATDYGLDRKINLIVQLSHSNDYEGGDLSLGHPEFMVAPRQIGTVIIFPAYYLHQITKITKGSRYSLIGHVWGPEFK